jgi:hypothetical protein
MTNAGDAFAFAFRDPGWPGKIVIQALITIIPIVGWIATAGWMMMTFDNIRNGRQELPPAGFHLERGIGIFGVVLIYGIVLHIPGGILNSAGAAAGSRNAFLGSPFSGLGSLLNFAAQLLLDFLIPALIVMTHHYGFAGGLDVGKVWSLATRNLNNGIVAGVLIFVSGVIAIAGLICCCIGIFLTIAYAATLNAGVAAWFERAQSQPA